MALSEHVKRVARKLFLSPFFIFAGIIVVFALGMLFGLGYLRYYVDGQSINRRAVDATLLLSLWEDPTFVRGELNLLRGNLEASLSEDGKTMVVSRIFSRENADLFLSEYTEGEWSRPTPLSGFINSGFEERGPHLSRDGKWLMFHSNRPDSFGGFDIYLSRRMGDRWSEPVRLNEGVNTDYDDAFPSLSPDGTELYIASKRPKPDAPRDMNASPEGKLKASEDWDIYRFKRVGFSAEGDQGIPLFDGGEYIASINTIADEMHPSMPSTGTALYFSSNRKDGKGGFDIYASRLFGDEFLPPENLGGPINTEHDQLFPVFANKGGQLLYVSNVFSLDPRQLKFYSSNAREVIAKFDYELLRNVLLILLLLAAAGVAIHYLLRFLLDSELKLLPRCLIASFLLHLILAALSGSVYLTSKIEERVSTSLTDMTINLNALARESISVAIMESFASLPQVQSPSTMQQVQVEVPVRNDSPINQRVSPTPQKVSVSETTMASETFTQVTQAPNAIRATDTSQMVSRLEFAPSKMTLESPVGLVQQGDGTELDPTFEERPEPMIQRTEERSTTRETIDYPMVAIEGTFEDTVTAEVQASSVANVSKTVLSGNLSTEIVKGVTESTEFQKVPDLVTSSPSSLSFNQDYGVLFFRSNILMEVMDGTSDDDEEEEFVSFASEKAGPVGHRIVLNRGFVEMRNPIEGSVSRSVYETRRFGEVQRVVTEVSPDRVGGLLSSKMPGLSVEVDSELEIPEEMLDEEDRNALPPML